MTIIEGSRSVDINDKEDDGSKQVLTFEVHNNCI